LILGDITIDVTQKNIKNLHLSVYPPAGRVRISAPNRMSLETIRAFAISKISWIRKHQKRQKNQQRETQREFRNRESHYYCGERYLLEIVEQNKPPHVVLRHSTIELHVRPEATYEKKKAVLDGWYRQQLKEKIPKLIEKYEAKMGVKVAEFGIKKMRTRWGTCNINAKRIWINLELAKKPPECLEYIVVHEMVHLLERKHNDRYRAFMDLYLPRWRVVKEELNRLPVVDGDRK
jgi:predicted metal-dependent hydrolase